MGETLDSAKIRSPDPDCPFCSRIPEAVRAGSAATFPDGYPVADGHRLVIPARHVERVEELEPVEWRELFDLVQAVAREVGSLPRVDGVNIGNTF